jgi:hypothetical protein
MKIQIERHTNTKTTEKCFQDGEDDGAPGFPPLPTLVIPSSLTTLGEVLQCEKVWRGLIHGNYLRGLRTINQSQLKITAHHNTPDHIIHTYTTNNHTVYSEIAKMTVPSKYAHYQINSYTHKFHILGTIPIYISTGCPRSPCTPGQNSILYSIVKWSTYI